MALDPNIPLGSQVGQFNPLQSLGQAMQIRGLQQEHQIRQLQIDDSTRKRGDVDALDRAGASGATTLDDYLKQLPGHLHAGVRKQWGDADKAAADAKEQRAKADIATADYFGGLAVSVKSYERGGPEAMGRAAGLALQHAKSQGLDVSEIAQHLQQDPSRLPP
jgi:hypothetical protein